ncbi:sialate O-acetylesterase [Flagellimonas onchidii]|uniref:sialate O-acetylesterase n=1 Tax=Flagellimonas onchidii TaxID=2562684 RepID=UPI0010A63004|nr:sialate O-acetylesterase [Allomuricauda onchidii]
MLNYDIAGAIWYQGESNRANSKSYYKSFPLLIESWRNLWDKDFPFYYVQIAPFDYDKDKKDIKAAVVRDAQLYTMLSVPYTGMAVTNDIGNLKNIHPTNKQEVGRRLALWALAKTYGVKDVEYSGPIYKSMEVKRNKIILTFDHAESGLSIKGKALKEFYIAGADKKFYEAKARIKGDKVEVYSSKVKKPEAVRFAFDDKALPNLMNNEGLPASAFRTDTWEISLE